MNKHLLFLSLALSLTLAQPTPAFFSGFGSGSKSATAAEKTSAWDKLVSSANETIKKSKKDEGNKDNPTWSQLTDRADKAMKQFAKDGKGFDITRRIERKLEKLAADENSTLIGRFYDLKQPLDPAKTKPLYREQVNNFIKNFMDADWDSEMLEQYYSPKVELAAPYFYLPYCLASYAPKAFRCNEGKQERQVEHRAWVVIYRGQVTAPKSGHFRFVGTCDDTIVVRFNEKVVLQAGWSISYLSNDMHKGSYKEYQNFISSPRGGCALYQYEEIPEWNKCLGGIQTGTKFHVKKGETYPIEILLSEIPGGRFGFCLFIEELENGKAPTGKYKVGEAPTLPLFRTNEMLPDLKEIEQELRKDGVNYAPETKLQIPPFLEDSPIWKVKSHGPRRSIVERAAASMSDEDTALGRRVENNGTDAVDAPEEDDTKPTPPAKRNNTRGKKK